MSENVVNLKLPKPHAGQLEVINSTARFKILMAGRRWGKSKCCQILAVKELLQGHSVAYISPTHDLNRKFFKQMERLIPAALIESSNKSELQIELINQGTIKFYSGEALGNMRGNSFHLVIIDEAAFIPTLKEGYNEEIRPTLTDFKGKLVAISTPKGKGFFHTLYLRGKVQQKDYQSWHFTSYDNPFIDPKEIDDAKAELPEASFNQEYLAIAGENANNPFGVDNIKANTIKELSKKPSVIYGIDIAKIQDWTVIIGLDEDGNMSHFERFKLPYEVTIGKIKTLPDNIVKIIDRTGVGEAIFERLLMETLNIMGFQFTSTSKPKLYFELIKEVEEGGLKFNEVVADEMLNFEFKYTSNGHPTFNASAGNTDDCVAALALSFRGLKDYQFYSGWKVYTV